MCSACCTFLPPVQQLVQQGTERVRVRRPHTTYVGVIAHNIRETVPATVITNLLPFLWENNIAIFHKTALPAEEPGAGCAAREACRRSLDPTSTLSVIAALPRLIYRHGFVSGEYRGHHSAG